MAKKIRRMNVAGQDYDIAPAAVATSTELGGIKASNTLLVDSGGVAKVVDDAHKHTASTINWGGANYAENILPVDLAMNEAASANKFAFIKPAGITVKYSRDAGATWLDYGATDGDKVRLTTIWNTSNFRIGKVTQNSEASTDCRLRVEIDRVNAGVYLNIRKFMLWVSTQGSTNNYVTISKLTKGNYDAGNTTDEFFEVVVYKQTLNGWSGWNVINTNIVFGTNTDIQARIIRFDFGYDTAPTGSNLGLVIYNIFAYCSESWTTASNLAKFGHLYSFDYLQNAIFPANVTAQKIIKSGGTFSQFLKADGSVDSNNYALSSTVLPATNSAVLVSRNLLSGILIKTDIPVSSTTTFFFLEIKGLTNVAGKVPIDTKFGAYKYNNSWNILSAHNNGYNISEIKLLDISGNIAFYINPIGNGTSLIAKCYQFKFDEYNTFVPVAKMNNHITEVKNTSLPQDATILYSVTPKQSVFTSDLETIATSGSYNDLSNKPTIATAATINGVSVDFSAQQNNIPAYITYSDVLYPCRIGDNGTTLQIYRNRVWADVIKSCSCGNAPIVVSGWDEINNTLHSEYQLSDEFTHNILNGKYFYPADGFKRDKLVLSLAPFTPKGYKVDVLKTFFGDFITATKARFFIENDLAAMFAATTDIYPRITITMGDMPKIVVECYREY